MSWVCELVGGVCFCVQDVQDRMGLMGGEGFRVGIYRIYSIN